MDWDTYYEKFYDWATSTQIKKMSSLTSFGTSAEVAEVAQEYAAQRAESERPLPAAVSAFWMARAFCPVLSALFFQASCSSCRPLILGTKKDISSL